MKDATAVLVERLAGRTPAVALVLGSGLGGLVDEVEDAVRIPYGDLPGFPQSGVTGHAGQIVAGNTEPLVFRQACREHHRVIGVAERIQRYVMADMDVSEEPRALAFENA